MSELTNNAARLFAAALSAHDWRYSIHDERTVRASFNLNNGDVTIYFIFGEDCTDVHIIGLDFCKAPKGKIDKLIPICNTLNQKFRWVKFYVRDEQNVWAEMDAVIQLDSCADECLELMSRMASICDDAIPIINKEIWS